MVHHSSTYKTETLPDILIQSFGMFAVFHPMNKIADLWIADHIGNDVEREKNGLIIEADDIAQLKTQMSVDGLIVR